MGGFVFFLLVCAFIGALVWQYAETRRALAPTAVTTALTTGAASRIVQEAFTGPRAVLWTSTRGPGTVNMRRRGIRGGITMSIDIRPTASGGSTVEMWASETLTYLVVLVNFAGVVNRRKNAIQRALTESTGGHSWS